MLSDSQIKAIVANAEGLAVSAYGSGSELEKKRTTLLKYYNREPFGDEVNGQSQVITSDVSDVVESVIPSLIRQYTSSRNIAEFSVGEIPSSMSPEDIEKREREAEEKTVYANYVFRHKGGTSILHSMIKDAMLQYTGTVKVFYDESNEVIPEPYRNLDKKELAKLKLDDELDINDIEENDDGTFNVDAVRNITSRGVCYEPVPPEEMLINDDARDFKRPRFIGQKKQNSTRSDLIEMGFDKDLVMSLSSDDEILSEGSHTRRADLNYNVGSQLDTDKSQDRIALGEYYLLMDVDEDGISELWQIFYAGNEVLEKNQVEDHPYAVAVPIPIPHRAIGDCPAAQVMDIQFTKSTLARQFMNNIYQTNYGRTVVNERVELDDLLTPRAGGVVRVEGNGPVSDSLYPIPVQPIGGEILQGIEYWDTSRETRTGITRYNQGLDTDSLNKTATGFKGLMDASQQRLYLMAKLVAETGLKQMFEKTVKLLARYQDEAQQIRVFGRKISIDPTSWRHNLTCDIDIGIGAGDRNEKIAGLQVVLNEQKMLKQMNSQLVDETKLYNTYEALVDEIGLMDASKFFNDTRVPDQVLRAQNEQARMVLEQVANQPGPLAEAEQVKAQAAKEIESMKAEVKLLTEQVKANEKSQELVADLTKFRQEMLFKLSELEMQYNEQIPGVSPSYEDGELTTIDLTGVQ